ncbi:MAG: hypothetical protein HOV79_30535 [Hamadaea sp.]|nr:hypothetical protein [Hamadaea sp.]
MREDVPGNDSGADPADEQTAQEDAGLTRAERRAKGKKGAQHQQAQGKPHFVPKNSGGHAQRLWSNRRAG